MQKLYLGIGNSLLMQMFGRPKGVLGRLGGIILAHSRAKQNFTEQVIRLLGVQPHDKVLEVGFGPGVGIQMLAGVVSRGLIAGIDVSKEMVEQAASRNAKAIKAGLVELQHGSVEQLPFSDRTFDKALAINSMQVWFDTKAGLQEIHRVLKAGGKIALGFTPQSRQSTVGLMEMLQAAGFTEATLVETQQGFCVLAKKSWKETQLCF